MLIQPPTPSIYPSAPTLTQTPIPTQSPTPTKTSTPAPKQTSIHELTVTPISKQTPTATPKLTPTPATSAPTPVAFEFGKKYEAYVYRVIDGDTIDVLIGDKIYRIRLLGVDCPETTVEKNKPYEYDAITDLEYLAIWGRKAKEFTELKLKGKTVYIEFDESAGLKGYYGRYLAYVYLKDGTDFNALLIKNGLARVYTEGTFKKESEYVKLEQFAKTNKIGLWAYSTYTTPTPTPALTPTPTSTQTATGVRIVYINYDAPGNDWYNPNGEYVVIKNYGPNPVNLKGWKLKDRAGHTFVFPDITLQPGESVYIHSGEGVNTGNTLYWGNGAIWNNDGDTAYLYDASGKLVDTYYY